MERRQRRSGLMALGVKLVISSIVLLSCVACSTSGGTAGAGSEPGAAATAQTASTGTDPDAVHQEWVKAMQHDDRTAALSTSAPQDQQAAVVDDDLRMMRGYVPTNAETGGVTTVEVQPVTVKNDERIGTSVWSFVKRSKACFQATLSSGTDGNWKVRKWSRITCP